MPPADSFDLVVIGGGINGCGIARDAAGRGLTVLLVEQHDLASGTSSRSSKLIHGGLRYLETGQFRLVRESLQERAVLAKIAPHLVRPLRFILPHGHGPGQRSRWALAAGLWLYDHLGGRGDLPRSGRVDLAHAPEGHPLLPAFPHGFHYADCSTADMRLVVVNAVDAARRGASVLTYTKLEAATATEDGRWRLRLVGTATPFRQEVSARVVINAAGPWAGEVLDTLHGKPAGRAPLRLVKGSHLVVPRLHDGPWAYLCPHTDGRVVFFLPFEDDFTLIGTTETPWSGDPSRATCSAEEETYLLDVAARFFRRPPSRLAVVHRFAGVRALYDAASSGRAHKDVSRDYHLSFTRTPAPQVSVFGGKLTTYRRLAERTLALLRPVFPHLSGDWTHLTPLPGGQLEGTREAFATRMQTRYPWLPAPLLHRWCRHYGSDLPTLMDDANRLADLGPEEAPGLCAREADYLRTHEFARTLDDIRWRRTWLGLRGNG